MKNQNIISIALAAIFVVASSFAGHAGCDAMADKNLQVAEGLTQEQIRELIEIAASSTDVGQQQASIEPN